MQYKISHHIHEINFETSTPFWEHPVHTNIIIFFGIRYIILFDFSVASVDSGDSDLMGIEDNGQFEFNTNSPGI